MIFTRSISKLQGELIKSEDNVANSDDNQRVRFNKRAINVYRRILKPIVPRVLLKKIVDNNIENNYKVGSIYGSTKEEYSVVPSNVDGHPSFTKDGRFMLTDTYADVEGYRHLVLLNCVTRKTYFLGKFYSNYNKVNWRTDLHPRFSIDEQFVSIDTNHFGKNQVVCLKIRWNLINEI